MPGVSNTTFEGKIWQTSLGWRLKKCCDSWFLTLMKQPTPNSVVIVRNGFVVAPIGVTLREGEGRGERTVDATATASERASSSSFRVEIPSLSLSLSLSVLNWYSQCRYVHLNGITIMGLPYIYHIRSGGVQGGRGKKYENFAGAINTTDSE